jgi:hypothetical protein
MQNTKGTHSRNRPQRNNQSKREPQCHEGSVDVAVNSLNVNENDVRNQNRPSTKAVKVGERSDADNKN